MDPLMLLLSTLLLSFLLYSLLFNKQNGGGRARPLPPGPKGWPVLGNLPQLGAKPHQTLSALSKTYGPLFRLRMGSKEVVVASSASVAAQFLRTYDANFSNRPPQSGAEHISYNYQGMGFIPYGPKWRMMRKVCALHLFSSKALDDHRPVRAAEVAVLARTLCARARSGSLTNLVQELTVCTTNVLSKTLLGWRLLEEAEENKEATEFKEMVLEFMRLAGEFNVGDFVPVLGWFDLQGIVRKMKKLHRRFDSFLDRVIEEHRAAAAAAAAAEGGDLLSVMKRLKEEGVDEDGGKLTDTNIKALLLDLFIAGTDTTSSTTEWALSELISHPEILKKAQMELDFVVGRDRLVCEADLPNLPFLQAIVKETFRLHPSTPLSLPRMAAEACEVNGYHIPKHATLLMNVWAIARDPTVWTDPLNFCPARFLPGGGYENVDVKGNDFEVIPFGAGRRICAGLSLGLKMVQFVTATLIHAFDWALPEGQYPEKLDMEEAYGMALRKTIPLMAHPIPRLTEKAYEVEC